MMADMTNGADARQAWRGLAEPWRLAFELAFAAFQAGSVPVGAVIVSGDGGVIARGRSRSNEREAPHRQVSDSHLAHAEINALLQLSPGDYWDHVVYTTLEPCLLCTAALTHAHVGRVRYAWPDPLFRGIEKLPELNTHVARRWAEREHGLTGPLAAWGLVLPLVSSIERRRRWPLQAYSTYFPELVALAGAIADGGGLQPRRTVDLLEALSVYWEQLVEACRTHDAD
jgi:tRNA(Arg) A34 adenosine deaminase TadA